MRVRSKSALPAGPWRGRAVLVYQRTSWFAGDTEPMVGLLSSGLGASVGGLELDGPFPLLRPGARLESDGTKWILEGVGELEGVSDAPELPRVLEPDPAEPPPGWKDRWRFWLDGELPATAEGRWLFGLLDGPGEPWEAVVGRGSGSTPAGDDFLAGWLAARGNRFSAADRRRLLRALTGTTRLSRHYLWHLAEGRVDPALGHFLSERPLPEPGSSAAEDLATRGDLSGRATLVGLVAGLTSGE